MTTIRINNCPNQPVTTLNRTSVIRLGNVPGRFRPSKHQATKKKHIRKKRK